MRQASALYRLLGDEARLRLLRVLAPRAAERHRAHRHPRPGAVGRLAAPRPAQGRRPGRRGEGRRLHLLPPVAGARRRRRPRALGGARRAVRRGRRPTRRCAPTRRGCRKCCGCGRRTSTRTAAPTRATRGSSCPGRSWAAWSRALGLLLPPLTVADLGCGEGYLTIEAARWASRSSPSIARRSCSSARKALGAPAPRLERHLEAGRAREAADQGRVGRRRAAVAGAAPRGEPGARRRRSGADHRAGRPRPGPRSARAPGRVGAREARRSDARLRRRRAEAHADAAPACATCKVGVGARKAGDPFTVLIASGTKPGSHEDTKTRSRRTASIVTS